MNKTMKQVYKEEKDQERSLMQEGEFSFFSKKLNKPFDSIAELKQAEQAAAEEEEAKKKAVEQKRSDAQKVEESFKRVNAARREYNEVVIQAKQAYLKEMANAKARFEQTLNESSAKVTAAEKEYAENLHEFSVAHGNNFHTTLKDDDVVVSIDRKSTNLDDSTVSDFFKSFFNFKDFKPFLKNFLDF